MSLHAPYKGQVQKFKLGWKSREQEAARLRENQRRHRARVKSRLEELETTLEGTQRKLEEALRKIDELNAEVLRLRQRSPQQLPLPPLSPPELNLVIDPQPESQLEPQPNASNSNTESELLHAQSDPNLSDPNDDCQFLPAPTPGESTITCREAYRIIREHMAEVDFEEATESLKPGFRRAVIPGTGCRVQTHILFSFVDRIT